MVREEYVRKKSALIRRAQVANRTNESSLRTKLNTGSAHRDWWKSFLLGERPRSLGAQGQQLRILDLFSGCGGLAVGLCEGARALGLNPEIRAAVDVDELGLGVYKHNLNPKCVIHASVTSLVDFHVFDSGNNAHFAYRPDLIDERLISLKGQIDLICAGPPCQGHSSLNNHTRGEDPRNLLYLSVPALAVALDVPVLVIENVSRILNDKSGVVPTALALLERNGYRITSGHISATELGWPQTRRRFFLVAIKETSPVSLLDTVRALKQPPASVGWAIDDLLNIQAENLFDTPADITFENMKRIDYLFDSDTFELPNAIRPDCHKDGHTYPSVYGRLRWDEPAGTITSGFLSPGRGRFIHPLSRRCITPHEAARLQGFPDWFRFLLPHDPMPSRKDLSKWIGDAVPPIMGYAVAFSALGPLLD